MSLLLETLNTTNSLSKTFCDTAFQPPTFHFLSQFVTFAHYSILASVLSGN